MSEDVCELGACELARAIARGELSSEAAVEAHIARIAQHDSRLNAVVCERFELARQEARAADARVREGGALPPLHGVPITLKESIDLAGTASTYGVERFRAPVAQDAEVVQRLRAAGAIVLAKSNVAQLLHYYESDNPVFGRTLHPYARERTPGGSSGGEAALVASGCSPCLTSYL